MFLLNAAKYFLSLSRNYALLEGKNTADFLYTGILLVFIQLHRMINFEIRCIRAPVDAKKCMLTGA